MVVVMDHMYAAIKSTSPHSASCLHDHTFAQSPLHESPTVGHSHNPDPEDYLSSCDVTFASVSVDSKAEKYLQKCDKTKIYKRCSKQSITSGKDSLKKQHTIDIELEILKKHSKDFIRNDDISAMNTSADGDNEDTAEYPQKIDSELASLNTTSKHLVSDSLDMAANLPTEVGIVNHAMPIISDIDNTSDENHHVAGKTKSSNKYSKQMVSCSDDTFKDNPEDENSGKAFKKCSKQKVIENKDTGEEKISKGEKLVCKNDISMNKATRTTLKKVSACDDMHNQQTNLDRVLNKSSEFEISEASERSSMSCESSGQLSTVINSKNSKLRPRTASSQDVQQRASGFIIDSSQSNIGIETEKTREKNCCTTQIESSDDQKSCKQNTYKPRRSCSQSFTKNPTDDDCDDNLENKMNDNTEMASRDDGEQRNNNLLEGSNSGDRKRPQDKIPSSLSEAKIRSSIKPTSEGSQEESDISLELQDSSVLQTSSATIQAEIRQNVEKSELSDTNSSHRPDKKHLPAPSITGRTGIKRNAEEAELSDTVKAQRTHEIAALRSDHGSYDKTKKRKETPSMSVSSPLVVKTLKEFGWKREVVYRGVFDETLKKKRPADVYYYTPEGKKLRSRVEIANFLAQNPMIPLTEDCFTFQKSPILEPPWEIVRQAGQHTKQGRPSKGGNTDEEYSPHSSVTKKDNYSSKNKNLGRNPDQKHTRGGQRRPEMEVLTNSIPSPEIIIDRAEESDSLDLYASKTSKTAESTSERQTDVVNKTPQTPPSKILITDQIKKEKHDSDSSVNKDKARTDDNSDDDNDLGPVHFQQAAKLTARKSTTARPAPKKHWDQLCSTQCPGLEGKHPELQCCICMCLFHHQCVNVQNSTKVSTFKCLRCKDLPIPIQNSPPTVTTPPPSLPSPSVHIINKSVPVARPPPLKALPQSMAAALPQSSAAIQTPTQTRPTAAKRLPLMHEALKQTAPPLSRLPLMHDVLKQFIPPPLMRPGSQIGVSGLKTDAIDILRNAVNQFNTVKMPPYVPVIRAPSSPITPAPPRLVIGGAVQPQVSSNGLTVPGQQAATMRPPPRLTAAPGVTVNSPDITINNASQVTDLSKGQLSVQNHAQLLTLPSAVISRLNLSRPIALKINNQHITIPPSCIIASKQGSEIKVLLPANTFSQSDSKKKLSVTVSNNPVAASNDPVTVSSNPVAAINIPVTVSNNNPEPLPHPLPTLQPVGHQSQQVNKGTTPPNEILHGSATTHSFSSTNNSDVQTTHKNNQANGLQAPKRKPEESDQKAQPKRHKSSTGINPGQCYMQKLCGGWDSMVHIFRYLGVLDLLRARQVCKTWLQIAELHCWWKHVDLGGLRVPDWKLAAQFLSTHAAQSLCLKGMGHFNDRNRTWHQLMSNLGMLSGLRRIEFGLVTSAVIHSITEKLTHLEVFCAEHITDLTTEEMWRIPTKVDIGKFSALTHLKELRLRGVSVLTMPAFEHKDRLSNLANLKHLHTLSLTSLSTTDASSFNFLQSLPQLEVLELGDCINWTSEVYGILGNLTQLHRLHLECGGEIPDNGLGDALGKLVRLQQLELMWFVIPSSLHSALIQLPKLHTLVIWPDTVGKLMPSLVNSNTFEAIKNLQQLKSLEWGLVLNEEKLESKQLVGDNIVTFLKPGTSLEPSGSLDSSAEFEMSITDFTQHLCTNFPNCTSIKITVSDQSSQNG